MPNFENNAFVSNEKENQESCRKNVDEQTEVIPNKEERHKLKNEQDVVFEEQKLAAFAKIMDGEEYYIAGGLAQEIDKGQIEYCHEDIDIIIFKDQEDKIINTLKNQGFNVFKKPTCTGHDLEATNFDIDESSGQTLKAPAQGPRLYIGIYVYTKNEDKKMAQRLKEDGTVNMDFPGVPLSYFDKKKQTLNYKGNELIIADLRSVVSSKLIRERPKDVIDVKNMMPILKERYNNEEIEELKNINKENIKDRSISSLKDWLEEFSRIDKEMNIENIVEYFSSRIEDSIKMIENGDYAMAARDFLDNIKKFAASSSDPKVIKNEFSEFMLDNFKPIAEYYNKIIDKAFE